MTSIDLVDVEDLARHVLSLDDDASSEDVWDALFERWVISIEDFSELADKLLECTIPVTEPLSGEMMHVLGRRDPDNPSVWVAMIRKPATGPGSQTEEGEGEGRE